MCALLLRLTPAGFTDSRCESKTTEWESVCLFALRGIDEITAQKIYKCPLSASLCLGRSSVAEASTDESTRWKRLRLSACCVFCCVSASRLHWNAPGFFFFLFLSKPSGSFFTHFKWTFYLTQRRVGGKKKKKNASHGIRASLNGIWWIRTKIFIAALLVCTTSADPSNSESVLYEAAGRLRCCSCLS